MEGETTREQPRPGGQGLRRRIAELERALAEQKRIETALQDVESRARAFLESAAEGVLIVNGAGRILLANPKAEAIFGYDRGELLGQPLGVLIPERLRDAHAAHLGGYVESPRVRSMGRGLELRGRRRDGIEVPVEVSLSFVETDEGIEAMAFVTDITARVAAEQAARQGDRLAALGTLAAGLVHEINNPLGIMISRLDVMLMEAQAQGLSPGVAEDLRVLRRQADRVVGIARGLLSFSRESPGAREPVDLNRVVTETVRLADAHITKRGGRIVARLDPTLPTILGQASALQQVVLNLLSNAGDALGGGGEIRIDTGPAPGLAGAVRLRITDTGAGIEPETLPRIFDPFFTTKASGTGLGLSISYGIVREHQGIIDVESRPGRGTTFTLTFPTFGAAIA